eukprot:3488228-Pyramimonas_sp.AAC.1
MGLEHRTQLEFYLIRHPRSSAPLGLGSMLTTGGLMVSSLEPGQRHSSDLVDMAAMCAAMMPVISGLVRNERPASAPEEFTARTGRFGLKFLRCSNIQI